MTGAPRVLDSLVAFDCRVTASERVGSHVVVFGSVLDIHVAGAGAPLIYANRAYGVPRRFQRRTARSAAANPALTLGCYQVFAPFVVPALVARLTKLHPGIALTLLESDQEHLIASLRRNDVEVALLYDFNLSSDLSITPLAELSPYVLLPEGHPLSLAPASRSRIWCANRWRCSTWSRAGNIFCPCSKIGILNPPSAFAPSPWKWCGGSWGMGLATASWRPNPPTT
jgi:hypothetical protein